MNIAHSISEAARKFPDKKSVVLSSPKKNSYQYPYYTFAEFESRSNQMARYFESVGITKGMRTLLFVKPCLDFSVITFALFKIGAVPVLIDPGMGVKNLLHSVKQVRPEALVGVRQVHWLKRLRPAAFSSVRFSVQVEKLPDLSYYDSSSAICPMEDSELAAILFTSGGTGIPKGVLYTHGILNFQTNALREMFSLDETQIDLPGFPLFALFTLAMGMTSVIPDMDPTKPAQCDPRKIVRNILENEVTFVAGSPAIWERVGKYCQQKSINLPTVKYVVMFGAPVRGEIHQSFQKVLINGDTFTPYGATECLPVSLISGSEVLQKHWDISRHGGGTCVGVPAPETRFQIIEVSDIPENDLKEVPLGTVGEITVQGPQVTPGYFDMPEETAKAKIRSGEELWHRMGDLGYLDQEGRLWFLGRKSHRVEDERGNCYYPLEIEAIFNQHPLVRRSALISVKVDGRRAPGLVIERHDGETQAGPEFRNEIHKLAASHEKARSLAMFFLCESFPVDVRHNIKIDRSKLSAWANGEGGFLCRRRLKKISPGLSISR